MHRYVKIWTNWTICTVKIVQHNKIAIACQPSSFPRSAFNGSLLFRICRINLTPWFSHKHLDVPEIKHRLPGENRKTKGGGVGGWKKDSWRKRREESKRRERNVKTQKQTKVCHIQTRMCISLFYIYIFSLTLRFWLPTAMCVNSCDPIRLRDEMTLSFKMARNII